MMRTMNFRTMGSDVNTIWDSPAPCPESWAYLPTWFEEWEQQLSRFRPDSELTQLNAHAGQPMLVSETLGAVLEIALSAAVISEGLVVPTILERLEAAGYRHSFEKMSASVQGGTSTILPVPDWRLIAYDPTGRVITLRAGMGLDFGGVAKGWAADKVARHFGGCGSVLIDVGGDIAVSGCRGDGSPWPIAVANPLSDASDSTLALLMLTGGGVATSGRDYRHWQQNGRPMHHLIDPRTGLPAVTDVMSATVVAPSAVEAEVAAKVLLLRGSHEGLAWIETQPTLAALVVCAEGDVLISARWMNYCWNG